MDFGEQIKKIRLERNFTQEQMAQKLNISRQAVSNWENNRNLPDIEMLITIAHAFHLSLDQLILGGTDMNNMVEKLIRDGSETRRARINLISVCVGAALLLLGLACIGIKAASVEYIDADGTLHENFFLLPIAFLFLFCGCVTFLVTGIRNVVSTLGKRWKTKAGRPLAYMAISFGTVLLCVSGLLVLAASNSGAELPSPGIAAPICGIGGFGLLLYGVAALFVKRRKRRTGGCQAPSEEEPQP